MEYNATVWKICYGDVFEFQVVGRYYYFQSIFWNAKKGAKRIVKLFFDGVSERPRDMESYLAESVSDYYLYNYWLVGEELKEAEEKFDRTFNYVGRYPSEFEKWKNEGPPFHINYWPIDDVRRWEEKPWNSYGSIDRTVELYKEKHRLREKWIADTEDALEYYPCWRVLNVPYHMLPDAYMLDVPIVTEDLADEVRFYANHATTPREYFIKRTKELSPKELEERIVAVKIATANRGKLKDEEVEFARAFEKERRQKELPDNKEERLNRRFEVDSANDEFRTDFCLGDVFEIRRGKKYYYFQTIRPINIYVDWNKEVKPRSYYLIKLFYAAFSKRPVDLAKTLESSPSQVIVSHVRYSDNIEFVSNFDVVCAWRDEDPRFFLYFDPTEIGMGVCPIKASIWIRADRPIYGSYFVEKYGAGYSFPPRFRAHPPLVPIKYNIYYKRNEQFSDKVVNVVEHYLKRGIFKIDDVWSQKRILSWATSNAREERAGYPQEELPKFEAYKYSATDLRRRVKKLVGAQRRRKLFSSEVIAGFEETLSEFVDSIVGKKDDKENIRKNAKTAIRKLNRANKKLDYELIETEEREELGVFFYMAGSYAGVDIRRLFDSTRDW